MENSEAPRLVVMEKSRPRGLMIDVKAGKFPDGQFGVTVILDPAAIVVAGDGERLPGMVLLPWQARLLAYALLHQAEAIDHGLESSAKV